MTTERQVTNFSDPFGPRQNFSGPRLSRAMIEPARRWHTRFMTKQRFLTSFGALALGLAIFGLTPTEAKATQVMCSNEYGHCEVQDAPSWISCTCNDESSTGGTGGDQYQGLTEAELMAVCEAELAYCLPDMDSGSGSSDTGGLDTGNTDTGTSDTGMSTSDTGNSEDTGSSESGTTGDPTTGDSGTSGESTGDSGTSGDDGGGTTSDSGTSGEGDSGTTSEGGGESDSDGGATDGAADEASAGNDDPAADQEGDGCSVANDSGLGALALFGMLGLLGLRSRKRAS